MKTQICETNYKLHDIIVRRGKDWTDEVHKRFERYLDGVVGTIERQCRYIEVRTNTYGLGLFCSKRTFVWVDVRTNFFSVQCFTGSGLIDGLKKANWITGSDNLGSPKFRVTDENTLQMAIKFGLKAYELALDYGA